jgi:hypothetical protein
MQNTHEPESRVTFNGSLGTKAGNDAHTRELKIHLSYRGLKPVEGDLKLICNMTTLVLKDGNSDLLVLEVNSELDNVSVAVFFGSLISMYN